MDDRYRHVIRTLAFVATANVAACTPPVECDCRDASADARQWIIQWYSGPCTPQDLDAGCVMPPPPVSGPLIPPGLEVASGADRVSTEAS